MDPKEWIESARDALDGYRNVSDDKMPDAIEVIAEKGFWLDFSMLDNILLASLSDDEPWTLVPLDLKFLRFLGDQPNFSFIDPNEEED